MRKEVGSVCAPPRPALLSLPPPEESQAPNGERLNAIECKVLVFWLLTFLQACTPQLSPFLPPTTTTTTTTSDPWRRVQQKPNLHHKVSYKEKKSPMSQKEKAVMVAKDVAALFFSFSFLRSLPLRPCWLGLYSIRAEPRSQALPCGGGI